MQTIRLRFCRVMECMTVFYWDSFGVPTTRLGNAHASMVAALAFGGCIDDTAYHFGASLKDLGANTFFFSKEDFTLEEVIKKSEEKRKELERMKEK